MSSFLERSDFARRIYSFSFESEVSILIRFDIYEIYANIANPTEATRDITC